MNEQAIEKIEKIIHDEFLKTYPPGSFKDAAKALYNAGYHLIPELKLLSNKEQFQSSLIGKYCYEDVKDVIKEACIFQRDYDLRQCNEIL